MNHAAIAGGLLLAATVLWYAYRGYCVRSRFQRLQKQGIPMMPHHPIFGHFGVVAKLMADMPADAHGDYLMVLIQENWRDVFPGCQRCPPAVYLDLWPVSPPMLLSLDPAVSAQFTQDVNLDKAPEQGAFLHPLTGNLDVSSCNGALWKLRRRLLSPGFSPQNVSLRVPDLLEEVEVFVDVLRRAVGPNGGWGPVFTLEEKATLLTLDFIGRFTLDVRLHEQTTPLTPFSAGMLDTLPWLTIHVHIGNFLGILNPWRQVKFWWNTRKMDSFLLPLLRDRIAALKQEGKDDRDQDETQLGKKEKQRSLMDMLLRAMVENGEDERTFLPYALAETKHTMFAGHETTAFVLAWVFLMLSHHPDVLDKMRAEHDAVLGPDPAAAMRAAPHLLSQIVYTNAVIKETMRVHTNVGTLRGGTPNFELYGLAGSGFEGTAFPTAGCVVWDGNFAIHRNPALWPRATEFLPERWLVTDPDDPLHPPHNAYRPFVQGPRNCVGQHLAMMEMKMVLVLVTRELELETAWEEWDALRGNTGKKGTVWGDRLYQVSKHGPPHVKDGMPVHVNATYRSGILVLWLICACIVASLIKYLTDDEASDHAARDDWASTDDDREGDDGNTPCNRLRVLCPGTSGNSEANRMLVSEASETSEANEGHEDHQMPPDRLAIAARHNATSCLLARLPEELLLDILEYLDSEALFFVRRTSRLFLRLFSSHALRQFHDRDGERLRFYFPEQPWVAQNLQGINREASAAPGSKSPPTPPAAPPCTGLPALVVHDVVANGLTWTAGTWFYTAHVDLSRYGDEPITAQDFRDCLADLRKNKGPQTTGAVRSTKRYG
ncbi:taurine catabolism dioxygenase family protein [Niveomyces insectorum RCEF 264]|uniref:Taurine catabolism dioxygenase family protein n=1 Tax=Niveomyces insectorum RCEF 264 TaxID=1081102 RepID=A0A167XSM0_9HYPO|nr:taurine catabolism dioxygenase family protein [Niveomyces insectorum RCEF 264]